MCSTKTIAIVEDDLLVAQYYQVVCADLGLKIVGVAHDADSAERLISETAPNVVLMDVKLGGKRDGVDVANNTRQTAPDTKIVFITGSSENATVERIKASRPDQILFKPVLASQLRDILT
jgi:two-component system, response regulator PdtaR